MEKTNRLILNELTSVEILALKPAEDGKGFILRLREALGMEQLQKIIFNKNAGEIFKCNLMEVVTVEMKLEVCKDGKQLDLSIRPFEIITLKFFN
jgi:alpha-mannosidase